jgi:hypothetical protein
MIAGEPIVYWQFDSEVLGDGVQLVKNVGTTGDDCHYDICQLPRKRGKDIFKENALNQNLRICINNDAIQFSLEVFEDLAILLPEISQS